MEWFRRRQKTIMWFLFVVVTVTFIGLWGGSQSFVGSPSDRGESGPGQYRVGDATLSEGELHDLVQALRVSGDWRRVVRDAPTDTAAYLARNWILRQCGGARLARDLGLSASGDELVLEIRRCVKGALGLPPTARLTDEKYREFLDEQGLRRAALEQLLEWRLLNRQLDQLAQLSTAATENDLFLAYLQEREALQVRCVEFDPAALRAEATPPSEAQVRASLLKAAFAPPDPGPGAPRNPLYGPARLKVEYLVAREQDLVGAVKEPTEEELRQEYEAQRAAWLRLPPELLGTAPAATIPAAPAATVPAAPAATVPAAPAASAAPPAAGPFLGFAEAKDELRRKLLHERASAKAEEVLQAAVEENNARVMQENLPMLPLAELAEKQKLAVHGVTQPLTREELAQFGPLAGLENPDWLYGREDREHPRVRELFVGPRQTTTGQAALRLVEYVAPEKLPEAEAAAAARQLLLEEAGAKLAQERAYQLRVDLDSRQADALAKFRLAERTLRPLPAGYAATLARLRKAGRLAQDPLPAEREAALRNWFLNQSKLLEDPGACVEDEFNLPVAPDQPPRTIRVVGQIVDRRLPSREEFRRDEVWREAQVRNLLQQYSDYTPGWQADRYARYYEVRGLDEYIQRAQAEILRLNQQREEPDHRHGPESPSPVPPATGPVAPAASPAAPAASPAAPAASPVAPAASPAAPE